ncbi:hypothetical protein MNBD_GAMMA21-2200 [hydrothermal vent metagenome]|uniref:Desulfoferrodoxin ferrous iron-binding domain-containing protein n=1 Tax=hydrothermal vent metagenome TaxID=652676 RepID=A0A3B1AG89_9ZZZZ
MDRRNFIHLAAAGGVAALFAPAVAVAGNAATALNTRMAGGVYYTAANPGRWSKKVSGHLPMIEKGDGKIQVVTGHAMTAHSHYITKHMLLDNNFNFLTEIMFDPIKQKAPQSEFDISKYNGTIYVVSHCNKHDAWVNSVTL